MERNNTLPAAIMVRDEEEQLAASSAIPAEIVPRNRADEAADLQRKLERMVEEKVAAAMQGDGANFQPFFQSKRIATAIKRLQTVDEQQKFANYFADWGCLVCERRDARHGSLGMCSTCYRKRAQRMQATLRKHRPEQDQPTFIDSMKLARQALEPSLLVLRKTQTGDEPM